MSEKTKEVSQLSDATYAHTLVIKSTHEYILNWPPWHLYLIFIDSFTIQTISLHCIFKFFDLFGFLGHYLLNIKKDPLHTFIPMWLVDGDSLMCYIVMMSGQSA